MYSAPRRQEPPLPAVTTGTQFFTLDDESVPVTGERPAALLEPRPQGRVQQHTVEHIINVLPYVQVLDVPVPQLGNQLLEVFRHLDSAVPEQVIDVPKISHDRIRYRLVDRDLRHPQMAEQLVELPTISTPSLLQQQGAELIVDNPVRGGRGGSGSGGLRGSLPEQNSKIVDIPVHSGGLQGFRPRQFSAASSSLPCSADEAADGFFSHFSPISKKCGVRAGR